MGRRMVGSLARAKLESGLKNSTTYSALGAIGSAIAATTCCLPLGVLSLAAGTAGASAVLTTLRPYLLVMSIVLIAFGFWQARRSKMCNRKPSVLSVILLWSAAVFVVISIAFPQIIAGILAG